MRITEREFDDWKQSPVTQEVFKFYRYEAHLRRYGVAMGEGTHGSFQEIGEKYLTTLKIAAEYENLENIEFDYIAGMYASEDEIQVEEQDDGDFPDRG